MKEKKPKIKATNVKYLLRAQLSEKKFFVSSTFTMGGTKFSGISQVFNVKGKMVPNKWNQHICWPRELDDKMFKLMESIKNDTKTDVPAKVESPATDTSTTSTEAVGEAKPPVATDQGDN